jgi:hypothetical protein
VCGRLERGRGLGCLKGIPATTGSCSFRLAEHEGDAMISEIQIHTIARQMFEKHGLQAIAQAARNALDCEHRGDADEASEWRHIEDAMKAMRGPHQS